MLGPEGGGFLLDTNALHKADNRGDARRVVVILEFHPHGKLPRMNDANPRADGLPCPSAKELPNGQKNPHWVHGVPGYPLFPPDVGVVPGRTLSVSGATQ